MSCYGWDLHGTQKQTDRLTKLMVDRTDSPYGRAPSFDHPSPHELLKVLIAFSASSPRPAFLRSKLKSAQVLQSRNDTACREATVVAGRGEGEREGSGSRH